MLAFSNLLLPSGGKFHGEFNSLFYSCVVPRQASALGDAKGQGVVWASAVAVL